MATPQVELKKPDPATKEEVKEEKGLSNDVLTKYQLASSVVGDVIKKFIPTVVEGKNVLDLCNEGDSAILHASSLIYTSKKLSSIPKGIAFPTSISVNNVVSHFSPLPSDKDVPVLKNGDVVKVMLGAHVDGYASVHAETIVIGASSESPVDGVKADAIKAAYEAAQAAMRTLKPTTKNFTITDLIQTIAKDYSCVPVENQLSCTHEQNVTDGKKRIIINPTPEQRRGTETEVAEEGEVWGVDVLVVTGEDGKAKQEESRTSIYKRDPSINYQLKMQTSRKVFTEITKKAGAFPFTLRSLEDEKRSRMGVTEAVQHALLRPYDVCLTAPGTVVAEFFFTLALLPAGPLLLSPAPFWYSADKVKSDKSIKDEETRALLTRKLREDKKKNKKKNGAAGAAASGEEGNTAGVADAPESGTKA